jgi:hypothetical protein
MSETGSDDKMLNEDPENKALKKGTVESTAPGESVLVCSLHHIPRDPVTLKNYNKCSRSYSYLWTYDLYGLVRNAFDTRKSITRASGRGLGLGNGDFLRPVKWHQAVRRVSFGAPGPYQPKVHGWFYVHELPGPGAVNFSYRTAPPPHLYTALNSGQCSKLITQNLLEINRKL